MADTKATEEEPSIEEILDSIRQIISEDSDEEDDSMMADESSPPPPPAKVNVEAKPAIMDQSAVDSIDFDAPPKKPEEDILELTDRVDDEKSSVEVDLIDAVEEVEPEPIEPEPEEEVMQGFDDELLTQGAENAAVSAITALVRKTAVEHNGITLEDIVRAELKPLLRGWLDKNLPTLIERLVQEELERVSKRVLED